jgi:hypothetical protein
LEAEIPEVAVIKRFLSVLEVDLGFVGVIQSKVLVLEL